MPAKSQDPHNSLHHRLWQVAKGPLIGLLIGVFAARAGIRDEVHPHYFGRQEWQKSDPQADGRTRPFDLSIQESLERRDPRLATEPAIRLVTWFGLPIATEYAGLDARAAYPGAPWYHLPSHWSLRLQSLFGAFGGVLGWLIAQQRSLGELRRQLVRIKTAQTPVTGPNEPSDKSIV